MFEALRNAVKAEGLKPREKLLLIIICDHLNAEKGQIAWPSNSKLADLSGFSKKTVIEAKKKLVEKGLLYSHQRFNSSNLYKVNIDKIKSYIPEKYADHFVYIDEGIQASVINSPTSETTSLAESNELTPEEQFLHPPSVKKLIYTPKIQINNLLKNEAFVIFANLIWECVRLTIGWLMPKKKKLLMTRVTTTTETSRLKHMNCYLIGSMTSWQL